MEKDAEKEPASALVAAEDRQQSAFIDDVIAAYHLAAPPEKRRFTLRCGPAVGVDDGGSAGILFVEQRREASPGPIEAITKGELGSDQAIGQSEPPSTGSMIERLASNFGISAGMMSLRRGIPPGGHFSRQ